MNDCANAKVWVHAEARGRGGEFGPKPLSTLRAQRSLREPTFSRTENAENAEEVRKVDEARSASPRLRVNLSSLEMV